MPRALAEALSFHRTPSLTISKEMPKRLRAPDREELAKSQTLHNASGHKY
jgi:hypothetical protein